MDNLFHSGYLLVRAFVARRDKLGPTASRLSVVPVTIYVSDEVAAPQVESAVDDLLASVGLDVEERDDPVLGSWFRRIWVRVRNGAHSPLIHEVTASAVHAADSRLVLSQDATVTATMMQNLGPVLTALQPTRDACIRAGALLIVKVDWVVSVHQLTAAQQLHLNHQPHLATAPHKVLQALELKQTGPAKAPNYVDASIPPQTLTNPEIDNS